jgi:hypothetical protein
LLRFDVADVFHTAAGGRVRTSNVARQTRGWERRDGRAWHHVRSGRLSCFVAFCDIRLKRYTCYMRSVDAMAFDVAERADHLEVRGVSRQEIVEALELLDKVRGVQADHVSATRSDLLRALMVQNVTLTPPATLAQAQRLATHRDALLATEVLTHESLRQLRGDARVSSTRTWLARRRDARELFTVTHNGRTLIPAFQFDEQGRPRPELKPVLSALLDAGVDGWNAWTWLTTPTSRLSGEVPAEAVGAAPDRVVRAATRFAARPVA